MKRKPVDSCDSHHKRRHVLSSSTPSPSRSLLHRRALLIVDVQHDFCPPHGSLAVPEANSILPVIDKIRNQHHWDEVVLTQDWHPPQHCSFYETHKGNPEAALFSKFILDDGTEQILWPVHCVQGSEGAMFHPDLKRHVTDHIVQKGTHVDVDSYSAFYDNLRRYRTHLTELLHSSGITHVYICGLALDYCVGYTALDSVTEGFKTTVILDATKGVTPASSSDMLTQLRAAGISIIDSCDIPRMTPSPSTLKSIPSQCQDDVLATPFHMSASTSPTMLSPSLSPLSMTSSPLISPSTTTSPSPSLSPRIMIGDAEGWGSTSSSCAGSPDIPRPRRVISELTLPMPVTTRSMVQHL